LGALEGDEARARRRARAAVDAPGRIAERGQALLERSGGGSAAFRRSCGAGGGCQGHEGQSDRDDDARRTWKHGHVRLDDASREFLHAMFAVKDWAASVVQLIMAVAVVRPQSAARASDETLVARAQRGDVAAFETLLARHDRGLRALAYRMLGTAAAMDDVLQEAYVRAFRGLDGFDGRAAFRTWLYRIVANACLDELRRTARRPQVGLDEAAERSDPGAEIPETSAQRLDLAAALDRLDPDLRLVVLMVDAEGFSYDEVSAVLGIPAGTVASRLSRARAALRPQLSSTRHGGASQ
jgi:RNA polymerase sigma-70 factor (ECF subfamily)